jgi:hypothetical protein
LALYRQTDDEQYQRLALRLVDQVHHILGRHRADDPRHGWISALDEGEGERHPTLGGLRIGKELNERKLGDPYDQRLEWDRDGQYYHYLTQWMHTLNQVGQVTGDERYRRWAIELAKTAHAAFTYTPPGGGRKRMFWKMSIDLSYPLVSSMGQHDPLDGLITYYELQATMPGEVRGSAWPDLDAEIADMARICEGKRWATEDPLGIGGLLSNACRLARQILEHGLERADLLGILLDDARTSLQAYARSDPLRLPAGYRLAFRELGLSIGLRAVAKLARSLEERLGSLGMHGQPGAQLKALARHIPLAEQIERFWFEPTNQESESWTAHREINMVMLATSLLLIP